MSTTAPSSNLFIYGERFGFLAIATFSVVILTFFFLMYYLYAGSSPNDLLPNKTPLNNKKDVGLADVINTNILSTGSSTVMGFFYLEDGDRTGTYDAVKADYIPLLYVSQNWSLELSPSPTNGGPMTARLRVSVAPSPSTATDINIMLPPIPYQKWVFIAILREGRRFDVIYDNRIVASQRLEHYPVNKSASLSAGNKRLRGSMIHIMIKDRRLTPSEVEAERLQFVDTNNMIPEDHTINVLFPKFTMPYFSTCPPGLPCEPITRPPDNNLLRWNTPYV